MDKIVEDTPRKIGWLFQDYTVEHGKWNETNYKAAEEEYENFLRYQAIHAHLSKIADMICELDGPENTIISADFDFYGGYVEFYDSNDRTTIIKL